MELAAIAHSVAKLLVHFFMKSGEAISKKAGESLWTKGVGVHKIILAKFHSDKDKRAVEVLQSLEKEPENEKLKEEIIILLTESLKKDPEFLNSLEKIVDFSDMESSSNTIVNNVSGDVKNLVNINRVDNMSL